MSNESEARWKVLQARMDADASRRHAARTAGARRATEARDARLKAAIEEAVKEAVRDAFGGGTPLSESAPLDGHTPTAVPAELAPAPTPLHELTMEAWSEYRTQFWADRMRTPRTPLTLGELLGVQPEDDGAA